MKILDNIIADKKIEIEAKSKIVSISDLEKQKDFTKKSRSLKESLKKSMSGIICEFKRKSPSNEKINYKSNVSKVINGYERAGAVGVSILTNKKYFDGSISDINEVKNSIDIPILRKEFIISEYQIVESKSIGADAILLIASILDKEEIKNYSSLAKDLGLEVLLEIHSINELNKISNTDVDIIGVNNRNLDTLDIDIENSVRIFEKIPSEFVKISESGISKVDSIIKLIKVGYDGFLIGENFMKTSKPEESAYNFIKKVENEI
jgi:indole-3-glycerol phosphate synthase